MVDKKGIVFDIAECSLHDGPGMRVTVFLKGCPLRCSWCHSPEGQKREAEILHFLNLPERLCGREWMAGELAEHLNTTTSFLPSKGVTFSGGEPLMQSDFLLQVLSKLDADIHTIVDTCGFVEQEDFLKVASRVSYLFFGLKLLDEAESIRWTKQSSKKVIENLLTLDSETNTPYRLRIPLLHNITDTKEHFCNLEKLCAKLKRLDRIDFLPSNPDAGAKYKAVNREFTPDFDVNHKAVLPNDLQIAFPYRLLNSNEIE